MTFRGAWGKHIPLHQLFRRRFYDSDGNEYEINQWSSTYGDFDEDGNATFFYDEFPLKKFTGDEVWLTPHYSHNWVAEDLIVITIQ